MKYLITLTPLNPFFFGGDKTFGTLGDKEKSNYLVHSRHFPQQTALLGMIRKEMLIQGGFLTKKIRGEWIDESLKPQAEALVGQTKFKFNEAQNFGKLKNLGAVFLMQEEQKFIKKVGIDLYEYKDGLLNYIIIKLKTLKWSKLNNGLTLKDFNYQWNEFCKKSKYYNPKEDIYDNFVSTDDKKILAHNDIFEAFTQIGIKKNGGDDAFFKQTSYFLKDNFKFAFYIESDFRLENSKVSLGADNSIFKLEVHKLEESEANDGLKYQDKNGYLTLLSDAYIPLSIKDNCTFAISSEINFRYLNNTFDKKIYQFQKSEKSYNFYEKGSVFIEPSSDLLKALNNPHLQKIGYNQHTHEEGKN